MHRSVHHVREDVAHFVWDNAIEPAQEVDDGAVVELEVRDASGGQLNRDSTTDDVAAPRVVGCFVPEAIFDEEAGR
jgi:acetamidase/formamidase